jgi:hypothetical protein
MKTNCDFEIEPNLQQSDRLGNRYPSGPKDNLCRLFQVCRHKGMSWFEAHRRALD